MKTILVQEGDKILCEWIVPEDYSRDENEDIAEAYLLVEREKASQGIIVFAKYRGQWMPNPNVKPFLKHLFQIGHRENGIEAIAEKDQSYSTIHGRGSYYDTPPSPFYDVLAAITNKTPPSFCKGIYSDNDITDEQHNELVTWIAKNIPIIWATNDSILEAVNLIVKRAVENNNINQKQDAIAEKQAND